MRLVAPPPREMGFRPVGWSVVGRFGRWLLAPAAWALIGVGCTGVCKGPACADEWPATRVAVHDEGTLKASTAVWTRARAWYDGQTEDGAGWSMAALEDRLLFGQPEAGAVVQSPIRDETRRVEPIRVWSAPGTRFGEAVVLLEGRNGGADLVVGAPGWDLDRGAVFVFRDIDASGLTMEAENSADLVLLGGAPGDKMGSGLAVCGDMDGDGRAELAIYAPWFARPDDDAWPLDASVPVPDLSGAVFVVLSGSTDTNDASEPWSHGPAFWGESVGAAAGHGMHCAHDHDGDGVADLVVGAPFQRTEPQGADFKDRGRVYIVSGGALPRSGRLDRVASIILDGSEREAWFGMSVSGLDALGSGDLAISAPGSRSGRGDVFVYAGQELARGGVPKPFLQISHLSEEADHFGRWLAAGDLDGDGADALFVGAPDAKDGRNGFDTGELWIYRPDTLAALDQNSTSTNTADQRVVGAQPFQRVGRKPLLTDLDGDGTDELLLPTRRAAPDE